MEEVPVGVSATAVDEDVFHIPERGLRERKAARDRGVPVENPDLALKVPVGRLRDYVVDRHETGNLTVRPEAVFG